MARRVAPEYRRGASTAGSRASCCAAPPPDGFLGIPIPEPLGGSGVEDPLGARGVRPGERAVPEARARPRTPRLLRGLARTAGRALRDLVGAARYTGSLAHVLAPPPANRSRILRGGSHRGWRFGMLECPLPALEAAGRAAGGTVNVTFVSVLLGGLRHYCAERGEDLPDIPISMPVSTRKLDEAMGGKQVRRSVPCRAASIADAAERIAEMHRRVEEVRGEPALECLGNITPLLNRAPSAVAAALRAQIDSHDQLVAGARRGAVHRGRQVRADLRVRPPSRDRADRRDVHARRDLLHRRQP